MKRIYWLFVLPALLAGCDSTPKGYVKVKPLIRLENVSVAVVPFQTANPNMATPAEGIMLAEYMGKALKQNLPDLTVVTPSEMGDALPASLNEGRWHEIAVKTGAKAIIVGEITALQTVYDDLLQCREGYVGVTIRLLDATQEPCKELMHVNELSYTFPEDPGDKFAPKFTSMTEQVFRAEMLKFMAQKAAGVFYEHLEKRRSTNIMDVKVRYESNDSQ